MIVFQHTPLMDAAAGATPQESPECCPVPDDWLDTGLVICTRCDRVTDSATLEAHNHVHDVADARMRGEPLLTPLRMVAATNQQAGIKQDGTPAKTAWRPNA